MSNTGKLNPSASLSIAGQVRVRTEDGAILAEGEKVWLCRCGGSARKPFCDGSHKTNGFEDLALGAPCAAAQVGSGRVIVTVQKDGPLQVDGPFTLHGAHGKPVYCGTQTWLCRCGQSRNKPFCDGSHRETNFNGG